MVSISRLPHHGRDPRRARPRRGANRARRLPGDPNGQANTSAVIEGFMASYRDYGLRTARRLPLYHRSARCTLGLSGRLFSTPTVLSLEGKSLAALSRCYGGRRCVTTVFGFGGTVRTIAALRRRVQVKLTSIGGSVTGLTIRHAAS